jgi:hypothetical protein
MVASTLVDAVILAIDASKTCSGSVLLVPEYRGALVQRYVPEHYVEVKTQAHHEDCVQHLVTRAAELGRMPVIVAETWTAGRWSFKTILGMGEGWGWWTAEVRRAEEHYGTPIHIERVTPNEWRDALFGAARQQDRLANKTQAVLYALARTGLRLPVDAAEGLAIGYWGAQNDNVHEAHRKWLKRQKVSKPSPLLKSKPPPS